MPLLLGAATALPGVISSVKQAVQAGRVKLQNSTPQAFREKAALDRQAAAAGVLPGQAGQYARLAGIQAGAVQNARLGAASSGDYLASLGAADQRRTAGEQQLGTQAAQYGIQAQKQVGANLMQQAAYQQRDRDEYNKTKAALTQASAENLNNAVQGGASYAAYGMNNAAGAQAGMGLNGRKADAALGEPLGMDTRSISLPAQAGAMPLPEELPYQAGYAPGFGVQGLNRSRYKIPRVGAY